MKKNSIWITAVIILAFIAAFYIYKRFEKKAEVYYWRCVPIEKGDVNVIVTATGSMAADTSVDVGVEVNGIIAKIKVDFNDVVKKGQVIAILDTTLYFAAVVDAKATLDRAQYTLEEDKREYDRSKNLFENKVAAQADFDLALTNYQTAQGNFVSAKAQLDKALINLRYCTITAPIPGVIVARNVQVGNMVIASFNSPVLYTIAYDLTKMQVQADVDEADIGMVKEGQTAKFTVDAYPDDIFSGVVTQIRKNPVTIQNVVNYVVIIEVPNPELKLMPGLTANSNILIQERRNVLKIPTNAFAFIPPIEYLGQAKLLPDSVRKSWIKKIHLTGELKKNQIVEADKTTGFLWIKSGMDIFPIQVSKGLNDGTFTEISGDLKEGYEVVTGLNHSPTAGDTQSSGSSSPFMPKFPTKKR